MRVSSAIVRDIPESLPRAPDTRPFITTSLDALGGRGTYDVREAPGAKRVHQVACLNVARGRVDDGEHATERVKRLEPNPVF